MTSRVGYVAIVGEPNVGKSTLVNHLVGAKLSIVSAKPQTTRRSVLGIRTDRYAQMIFIDTPGVLTPRYLLHERMIGYVERALADADALLLMLDASTPDLDRLFSTPLGDVRSLGKPMICVLNKVDLLHEKKQLLPAMAKLIDLGVFREVVPISALNGDNVEELATAIGRLLPEGELLYDPDQLSEQPERFFVAELIREQALHLYRQEIPYAMEVQIVEYKERALPEKTYIHAELVVERDTQKRIVIGSKGESLRRLGERARTAIEEFLGVPVYLELFVKVREDWRSSEGKLRSFGY